MNFDRFGFKAKSQRHRNWLYATLDLYSNCYGVRYHFEHGGDCAYSPAWIKPETICQCTGIRDSDGRLIYENDILSVEKPGEEIEKATVIFSVSDNSMIVKMRGVKFYWLSRFIWSVRRDNWKVKVIGNKFDKEEKDDNAENN